MGLRACLPCLLTTPPTRPPVYLHFISTTNRAQEHSIRTNPHCHCVRASHIHSPMNLGAGVYVEVHVVTDIQAPGHGHGQDAAWFPPLPLPSPSFLLPAPSSFPFCIQPPFRGLFLFEISYINVLYPSRRLMTALLGCNLLFLTCYIDLSYLSAN